MSRLFASAVGFLALLAFTSPLHAVIPTDVFVYKGTIRYKSSLNEGSITPEFAPPPTVRAYFIIDYNTGETAVITYYTKGGKKQANDFERFHATRTELPNGKTATLLATGSSNPPDEGGFLGNNSFSFRYAGFRGVDTALRIETVPEPREVNRPRVLKGMISRTSGDSAEFGGFNEASYLVSLQAALTVDANNNDKTVEQVGTEIIARLTEQGYENLD